MQYINISMGSFKYVESMGRPFRDDAYIIRITFPISRYECYTMEKRFPSPVTEKEAIAAVEKYLSKPLEEGYYEQIKSDLWFDPIPFEEVLNEFNGKETTRGDIMTDLKFLEDIIAPNPRHPGEVEIMLGS